MHLSLSLKLGFPSSPPKASASNPPSPFRPSTIPPPCLSESRRITTPSTVYNLVHIHAYFFYDAPNLYFAVSPHNSILV
ncbi:hypothetical protein L1887_15727 [Cichorium endivia]|nr:hypothetical protein L1887_15727 [Cichorium endivia]